MMTWQEAMDCASKLLKSAGFELRTVSMQSEACYYGLPDRAALLRVAAHRGERRARRQQVITHGPVVASINFGSRTGSIPGTVKFNEVSVENSLCLAVGKYVLKAPRK